MADVANSADAAIAAGYTRRVTGDCAMASLELLVKPDVDLDGEFTAFDTDDQEWLTINGWNWIFEEAE